MLTKQSIRGTVQIYMNTLLIEDKEVILKKVKIGMNLKKYYLEKCYNKEVIFQLEIISFVL